MDSRSRKLQQLFTEGSALLQVGNAAEALSCFRDALGIAPSNPTLLLYAGTALHDLKQYDEAISAYQTALQASPDMGELHNNLGNSLLALGRFDEAEESLSRAADLLPQSPVPAAALATALQARNRVAEAETACRAALAIDPSFAAAHWNLSLNLLLQGRYEEGWQEYEWRWQKPDFTSPVRHADIPLWDGSPLDGRTILLHAEQGFGDAIQFVRYAPMVAQSGGTVILECHPQLVSLFRSVEGVQSVVPFGASLPNVSCQAPLLSLPRILGTTLQTIPSSVPYLSVTEEKSAKWSEIISGSPQGLRVGLVWAGKDYPDRLRTCRLEQLAPLMSDRVTFFSLQMGSGAEQISSPPTGMQLTDLTSNILDFSDTAALIEQLDLVISIDTAVSHLAGALGKPVVLMLPYAPDWRWLLDRSDSPWYPGMRLFRQEKRGEWTGVIRQIADCLPRKNKAS
jgi:Tfp pilus assembly protein PilF